MKLATAFLLLALAIFMTAAEDRTDFIDGNEKASIRDLFKAQTERTKSAVRASKQFNFDSNHLLDLPDLPDLPELPWPSLGLGPDTQASLPQIPGASPLWTPPDFSGIYDKMPGVSLFKIVSFPNSPCNTGSSRNGTCYTSSECKTRGGSSSGACAQGYGVCCVFTLSCGGECKENCTYIDQPATAAAPDSPGGGNTCIYKVCKCADSVCRIRFDFDTFILAGPQTGRTTEGEASATTGGGVGDCTTDQFSISSPDNVGSPVICGFNTGQHMIVDASDQCNKAIFTIGASSDTREWNIKVTQYKCGDELGGPDSCLQYFTGRSGTISSYNFPTTDSTVGADTTHLSGQKYSLCFRREEGACAICFSAAISRPPGDVDDQTSYGLGVSGDASSVTSVRGSLCSRDYLVIPNAENAPLSINTVNGRESRICGRIFSASDDEVGHSVCSQSKPFRVYFHTDASEVTSAGGSGVADQNEISLAPGGILGFSLNYQQIDC